MEWRALEEHLRDAVTPEPGPFGEDAFEWDYSRYARGLGLTAEPAADDLPHRGCAVLALPPARWGTAEEKYRAWAEKHGWAVWRFSARPTVAALDPVVYALGARCGVALAATPVVPAMGRRPRSEGMSFPLTPGERWLIATNRVRQRMRAEVGMRGLVLFVDEAEWLAPAALAVLVYLLDAHRAWQARMLSRPARAYVVFATAPQHEGSVVRMLKRFGVSGHVPVARERRKGASGEPCLVLRDIEEEHLFGALAAAPAALAEEDVRALFGASAIERCRALAERGFLQVRKEAGRTCFLPDPAVPAGLATPSPRALRGIDGRYRQLARRGYEHLALARAGLSLELGAPLRAAAGVARMPHTAGALLPMRVFEALDATLDRARGRLRADHAAAWFSLAAHQRTYDHARELANVVTDRELRTWKEACRVVQVMLCTGRTHLDTCLPPDFWPRLKSQNLGPFMDATCVLGEMFWRKRNLGNEDIRQRYEFACDCFARWERPRSVWFERLERLVHLTTYRAALHIGIPSNVLSIAQGVDAVPQETLRSFLRRSQLPAYVAAAPMFAEAATGYVCPPRSFDLRDRLVAMVLTSTTGQPEDLAVMMATAAGQLCRRGARLLLRSTIDEILLSLPRRVAPGDRHHLGKFLRSTAGGRAMLATVNALCLADLPGRDADEDSLAATSLMLAGDLVGARDRIMAAIATQPRWPLTLTTLITKYIELCRRALDVDLLASAAAVVERNRDALAPDMRDYLAAFLAGSKALCAGHFEEAGRQFWIARNGIVNTFEWATLLRTQAALAARAAHYARMCISRWSSGSRGPSIWSVMRALCNGPEWWNASSSFRARCALRLDYIAPVIEAWSRHARDGDDVLRVACFLREAVDAVFRPLGREFVAVMAQCAPTFYQHLRSALRGRVGGVGFGADSRAMSTALRTVENAWMAGGEVAIGDRCARVIVRSHGSMVKQARKAHGAWYYDAATYACLWRPDGRIRAGDFSKVAYGYLGASGSKPLATALDFHVTPLDNETFDVVVEAGVLPVRSRRRAVGGREQAIAFQGQSGSAEKVRSMIASAAKCCYPVLIIGETGVGKDLVARCIHAASASRDRSMTVAECGGIAESLLESELFGHERGAFTGAHARHDGFFDRANGSTLFLDELDSMSARLQAMLLRVLETGEYRPVGASSARRSEFRLIGAALPRLLSMVEGGQFRRDLLYRISTLRIEVPPLRERGGDAGEIAASHARTLGARLTSGALRAIAAYEWPGNVRQLRHCVQAASLHGRDGRIGEAAIGDVIATYGRAASSVAREETRGLDAAWVRALGTLEQMGRFGAWDFARAAGLSRRSAQRYVVQLLEDGRIARLGAGRATRYSIRT